MAHMEGQSAQPLIPLPDPPALPPNKTCTDPERLPLDCDNHPRSCQRPFLCKTVMEMITMHLGRVSDAFRRVSISKKNEELAVDEQV